MREDEKEKETLEEILEARELKNEGESLLKPTENKACIYDFYKADSAFC